MNKFFPIFFCLLLTFGISGHLSATVIDTDVELNGVILSGFRSDSNDNLEWLDLNTKDWQFDYLSRIITEPAYGWRLATYGEWYEMAKDLSVGEFTLDEWHIIGGTELVENYHQAYALIEYYPPNTQVGSITFFYGSESTDFYGGDSFVPPMAAWMVRDAAPVPEPATMFLFGMGLLAIAGISGKNNICRH